MQLLALNDNVDMDQGYNEEDIEDGNAITPLLDVNTNFDIDSILRARQLLEVQTGVGKNNVILPNGGYIILFDLNGDRNKTSRTAENNSLDKAQVLLKKIRTQVSSTWLPSNTRYNSSLSSSI